MIERIGFIGTGAITEAIVTGLVAAAHELREILGLTSQSRNSSKSARQICIGSRRPGQSGFLGQIRPALPGHATSGCATDLSHFI